MRFNLSYVVCLLFFALVGTVVVALIFKLEGPPETSSKLVTSQVSEPIVRVDETTLTTPAATTTTTTTTTERPDSFLEEEEIEPKIEKIVRVRRQLPDDYMTTLELYRNRLRIARGEELKKLTAQDFREGYGLYKIPTKAEIKKQLGRGLDKN